MTGTRLHLLVIAGLAIPLSTQCSDSSPNNVVLPGSFGQGGSGGARSDGSGGGAGRTSTGGSGGSAPSSSGGVSGQGGSGGGAGAIGSGGSGAGGGGGPAIDAVVAEVSELEVGEGDGSIDPDGGEADVIAEPICGNVTKAVGDNGLVDNFEDGDATSEGNDGRFGQWWLALSPTTTATGVPMNGGPLIPVTGGQMGRGMRVRGMESLATGWGANLSVGVGGIADCYDASVYTGLEFWIKGKVGSKVSVAIQTAQVRALSRDVVGFWRGVVTVTAAWKKETVNFADLIEDYGAPPPFDVTKVTGIAFEPIVDPTEPTTRSFDFMIDNVALVK
jgi:hypothetical protein